MKKTQHVLRTGARTTVTREPAFNIEQRVIAKRTAPEKRHQRFQQAHYRVKRKTKGVIVELKHLP